MGRSSTRGPAERGQALPVVVLLLALAGAVVVGAGRLGVATVDAAEAQVAADAAALAGAAEGEVSARSVAEANGARVLDVRGGVTDLTVTVVVGEARAQARAVVDLPTGGVARAGLAPAMVAALARAEDLLGEPIVVVSGYRSRADQERLWAARDTNPYPVAMPGTSLHEQGLAVDVPPAQAEALAPLAAAAGLCRPLPGSDPVHFELCRWSPR